MMPGIGVSMSPQRSTSQGENYCVLFSSIFQMYSHVPGILLSVAVSFFFLITWSEAKKGASQLCFEANKPLIVFLELFEAK